MAYEVEGSSATKLEYFVSLALDKLGITYIFHYAPYGQRQLRGEFYIDFLCFLPRPTAVEVYGEHWHEGAMKPYDRWRINEIRILLGNEPIILYEDEVNTKEKALETCRLKIGVAL